MRSENARLSELNAKLSAISSSSDTSSSPAWANPTHLRCDVPALGLLRLCLRAQFSNEAPKTPLKEISLRS
jgi:hypothetical protein